MRPISYARATGIDDALRLGAEPAASFYAGGTTLIDLMKLDVLAPDTLVDINHVALAQVEVDEDGVHLGALARLSDVMDDARVSERLPAVTQALAQSASGQLRNMATLGGNLLQRTRCAYFRDVASACNKRVPGSGCGARRGINDEHAILGTSADCIAVHASDFAVPLVAFDAIVRTRSRAGSRSIAAADFFVQPGTSPERETPLAPGELIVGIDVPAGPAAANSIYVKVRDRTSYAFALVSCAVGAVRAADGTIADVRIALGGVATVPWRARSSEDALRGQRPADGLFVEAARTAFADARPTRQNAYKIDLAVAAIVRGLRAVLA